MIFAQLDNVPAEAIKNWILIAMGLLVMAVSLKSLFGSKQKREVSFEESPASKREFDQHVAATEKNFRAVREELKSDRDANQIHASKRSETIFREIKETRETLEHQLDQQTEKLEKRINRISVGVARLCGKANVPMPSEEAEL